MEKEPTNPQGPYERVCESTQEILAERTLQAFQAKYCQLTGRHLTWNTGRSGLWWTWWTSRGKDAPRYTMDDLTAVIHYTQEKIRAGRCKPESLSLRYLIGYPEDFEETLAMLKAMKRKPVVDQARLDALRSYHPANRPKDDEGPAALPAGDIVKRLVGKMRIAVDNGGNVDQ